MEKNKIKKYIAEVEYIEYDEIEVKAKNRRQARRKVEEEMDMCGQITSLYEAKE